MRTIQDTRNIKDGDYAGFLPDINEMRDSIKQHLVKSMVNHGCLRHCRYRRCHGYRDHNQLRKSIIAMDKSNQITHRCHRFHSSSPIKKE
ncbi:predicted protein [Lichtheimia corymbifera JMRC:FSU:9682]|uniref:Uncharacterized protein n=1 Tax=Lichtheimia corymbifera JMRC:FSU:9682 TaxID=1263082 RepID=A0A068RND8_9FUNG|nr:predicted protein [Lichtheimia corymbifera JMRC:FSU:9682]